MSSPHRPRHVLGIPVTWQVITLIAVTLGLTSVLALAILSWLESTA